MPRTSPDTLTVNFVLPGLFIGGGVRVVFEYANRLSKRGHEVTILYPTVPTRMGEVETPLRARLKQIVHSTRRAVGGHDVDWFDLAEVDLRRIPALNPDFGSFAEHFVPDGDVTIATSWETAHLVDTLSPSIGSKAYFVQHYEIWRLWNSKECWDRVERRSDDPTEYPLLMADVDPPTPEMRREKTLVDESYRMNLHKITISSWLERLLSEKFDQQVVSTIFNSVNHDTFYYDPSTENTEEPQILVPYRTAPWKGTEQARELLDALAEGSMPVGLHTFGSSGNGEDLPRSVTQHGRVSDDELRRLYSDADVLVIPSWVEGFHLPPLEGMACKTAVVATKVGCVPDIAPDGEKVRAVPPRDSEELINAVKELLADPDERTRIEETGHEFVTSYSWEDCTDEFERTLFEISSTN